MPADANAGGDVAQDAESLAPAGPDPVEVPPIAPSPVEPNPAVQPPQEGVNPGGAQEDSEPVAQAPLPQQQPEDPQDPVDPVPAPPAEEGFKPQDLVGKYTGGQIYFGDERENFEQHQLVLDFVKLHDVKMLTVTVTLNNQSLYLKGAWPEDNTGPVRLSSKVQGMRCVINKAQNLLLDRIIDMACVSDDLAVRFEGYGFGSAEKTTGTFFAHASNFYVGPQAVFQIGGDAADYLDFQGHTVTFEVFFEDVFMGLDVFIDGVYNGRLVGQVSLEENFVVIRQDDVTQLHSCKVDSAKLFAHFDNNTMPVLDLIACDAGTFGVGVENLQPLLLDLEL